MKNGYWMLDGNVFAYEDSALAYALSVGKKPHHIKQVQIIWDDHTYLNLAQAQIMNPDLRFMATGKDGHVVGLKALGDFVIGRYCSKGKGSDTLLGDAHMRLMPTLNQNVLAPPIGVN